MGPCDISDSNMAGYWSSTLASPAPAGFDPGDGNGFYYPTNTAEFQFRCVTNN
jgi:hypothetical protein